MTTFTFSQALRSKTIQKAVITGVAGVAVAVLTEFDFIGYIVVVNAIADTMLRAITSEPLSAK